MSKTDRAVAKLRGTDRLGSSSATGRPSQRAMLAGELRRTRCPMNVSLFILLAFTLVLSGCVAHAIGFVSWTVLPSIARGAEMRAAREASAAPVVSAPPETPADAARPPAPPE